MKLNVNPAKDFVDVSENVAGSLTKVMEVIIPTGVTALLQNGTKLIAKLTKSDGSEIDRNSEIVVTIGQYRDRLGVEVDTFAYSNYYGVDIDKQRENDDDGYLFALEQSLNLKPNQKLMMFLDSEDVIESSDIVVDFQLYTNQ